MIAYIITIKDFRKASGIDQYQNLIQRCVDSIAAQTDSRFHIVLIASRSLQNIKLPRGKFNILGTHRPMPEDTRYSLNMDKSEKLLAGMQFSRNLGADFCVTLDSDDCVHKELTSWIYKLDLPTVGWYLDRGYIYKEGSPLAWLSRRKFYTFCGSSVIIRTEYINQLMAKFCEERQPYFTLRSTILPGGVALQPFPYPAVLYSVMNGENIHRTAANVADIKNGRSRVRFYARQMTQFWPRIATTNFRKSFGLSLINQAPPTSEGSVEEAL